MMSMSGGWFFVVASEAVSVGNNSWKLPGIGSYVALALENSDIRAVCYAIAAMLLVILAYDQLLFRPLVAWSMKFRFETTAGATASDPWLLRLMRRAPVLDPVGGGGGEGVGVAWRRGGASRRIAIPSIASSQACEGRAAVARDRCGVACWVGGRPGLGGDPHR